MKHTACLLATALLFTAYGFAAVAADGMVYEGTSVRMGKGTARAIVRTDASGKPISVAAEFSADALDGLPSELNKKTAEGQWEYFLPMPAGGPNTGYKLIVIDWNLHGHPPPHVYTVPHFDFHFYTIEQSAVQNISFAGPTDPAIKVSDAGLIPSDYKVIPETAINQMGVHAIDLTASEFHGKPFTATFIYGYHQGQLIFVEPMITRAFLQAKPDLHLSVKVPERYSHSGYYPTNYSVRYDSGRNAYLVELGGLKQWEAAASAAPKR